MGDWFLLFFLPSAGLAGVLCGSRGLTTGGSTGGRPSFWLMMILSGLQFDLNS
jgi:hypothetical protein